MQTTHSHDLPRVPLHLPASRRVASRLEPSARTLSGPTTSNGEGPIIGLRTAARCLRAASDCFFSCSKRTARRVSLLSRKRSRWPPTAADPIRVRPATMGAARAGGDRTKLRVRMATRATGSSEGASPARNFNHAASSFRAGPTEQVRRSGPSIYDNAAKIRLTATPSGARCRHSRRRKMMPVARK